jgi:putative Ca2+/H+ antiporter (TMEM165/GDT1 family)
MNWEAFLSALGLVFVAEFGDKTQLAVVTQTCKHGKPWAVFAGASAGLIAVTALGAIAGQALAQLIPEGTLSVAAGLAFVAMGLLIARDAYRAGIGRSNGENCSNPGRKRPDCNPISGWDWRAFSSSFALLFVAELGDKTQLAVLSLSGRYGDAWAVFVGGATALTLVTGLAAAGGQVLTELVPRRVLQWASAFVFIIMGALVAAGVL